MFYQRSLTGTDGGATLTVTLAPEPTACTHLSPVALHRMSPNRRPGLDPGPSLGSGGSISG